MGAILPTEQQFNALMAMDDDMGPMHMINLLRFRDQADYSDHPDQKPCSGKEAYDRYGEAVIPILAELGARPAWMSDVALTFIAPEEERWDQCLIVQWNTVGDFKKLMASEDYHKVAFHRDAATSDTRLIIAHSRFADFTD